MTLFWYAIWFLIAVSLLVTVHEYGHYWVARKLGFKVLRFSVGFGRPLWSRVAGPDRTEYVFAALPLGGYVKLLDEREGPVASAELPRSFTRKPPWQRILVLLAGPAANILFAILLLWGVLWIAGEPSVRAVIGSVTPDSIVDRAGLRRGDEVLTINERSVDDQSDVILGLVEAMSGNGVAELTVRGSDGATRPVALRVDDPATRRALTEPSAFDGGFGFRFWAPPSPPVIGRVIAGGPADRAGLQAGDRVLSVDGTSVDSFPRIVELVSARPGRDIVIEIDRAGRKERVRVTPESEMLDGVAVGRIRIETKPGRVPLPRDMLATRTFGPIEALGEATWQAWETTVFQARMFWRMITGKVSLKNLSGPVSIAEYAGDSASVGLHPFLRFLVLISLSLGFLNLLPIPILDGGQILYQLAEWAKGSPLSERVQALGQQVGIALLLLLMGVALFNDLARQFQPG